MLDISVETFEQIPFYSNLQILISSGVMFFCVLLIKVTNNRKVIIKSKNLLFLYPTICIIVLFMFSKTIERSLVNVSFYKVYIIITMLFLISNLLIVYVIKRINNVEMENEKLNFTNRYLKIEKQHQENLVELHNETRKIQHDLKSGLLHISGLLKAHNYTECINLLDKLLGLVYNLDLIINTGYSGLDALLSSKLIFAKTKSVQIVTLIALPDKDILIIDEFDLSLICGNILDNAIEATEKCFKSKHTIEFQMTYDSSTKLLRICCQNPTISKNSTLVTTKKDKFHHGFGLNNIKDISKKWKGMVQHDISNGIFSIIVTLHNDL